MKTTHKKVLKKVLVLAALATFVAYSGYRTHTTGPGVSSDRWTGLFWLSMVALAFWALMSIPRIGGARPPRPPRD